MAELKPYHFYKFVDGPKEHYCVKECKGHRFFVTFSGTDDDGVTWAHTNCYDCENLFQLRYLEEYEFEDIGVPDKEDFQNHPWLDMYIDDDLEAARESKRGG